MKFTRTVLGTCSGTEVFKRLLDASLSQTLRHLFLLALTCSSLIMLCHAWAVWSRISAAFDTLTLNFGEVKSSDKRLTPTLEPDQSRTLLLLDDWRLDYFSKAQSVDFKNLADLDTPFGIVWMPNMILMWREYQVAGLFSWGENQRRICYSVLPLFHPGPEVFYPTKSLDEKGLVEIIKLNSDPELAKRNDIEVVSFPGDCRIGPQIWRMIEAIGGPRIGFSAVWLVGLFLASLTSIFFFTLFYTAVSCLVFYLMSRPTLVLKNFKQLFVVATYAGFPAILVASCFPAFDLRFADYPTVYLIGFMGYFFVVINRLESKPEDSKEDFR